jgi:uncharacterized protein (UPF0276 family)
MPRDFLDIKKQLPTLGVGLGLRREIAEETFENSSAIDWLEFVPENYMRLGGMARERLETAQQLFPLVSHGVNLSIGSTDDLNKDYLSALKDVLDRTNSPWWSDHLCFTSVEKKYMHDLLPLPFTKEAVKHIAERIKRVQDYTQRPFLIENISYYMNMPGCEMSDGQFLAEIVEAADCGILLDVNNIYVNSINHKFDPIDYLKQIPIERTVQMHVAGHKKIGNYIIDTHGAALIEPVYELLKYVLEKTDVRAVLLERDQNFPEFNELMDELNRIRQIAADAKNTLVNTREKRAAVAVGERQTRRDSQAVKGGRDLRALSA